MNNIELYQRVNNMQRQDAECVVRDFRHHIQWRPSGGDRILDVGCGPGDVCIECFLPIVPHQFDKLIGCDISDEMVQCASKRYCADERIQFRTLDISTDELPVDLIGHFDHVTSFYCLHWVLDQRKALGNIYDLLKCGGDCLLLIASRHPLFSIYIAMSKLPQWQPYMQDVQNYISPLFRFADVSAEYTQLLRDVGFVQCTVQERDTSFVYQHFEAVRDGLRALNPFVGRMPLGIQEAYMNDVTTRVLKLRGAEAPFEVAYKYTVVYARR